MAQRTTQWFLSLQMTLYLLLIVAKGQEDAEEAYKNGRSLVLEYFLPINLPQAVDEPLRREKRDVEGSGEDEAEFSEIKVEENADNSTQNAVAKFLLEEEPGRSLTDVEGSGEAEDASESSEHKSDTTVPVIGESESEVLTSTDMIFDKSEDLEEISTAKPGETTTEPVILINENEETTTVERLPEESTTEMERSRNEAAMPTPEETTTGKPQTTTIVEETTTVSVTETITLAPHEEKSTKPPTPITTTLETTTAELPIVVPHGTERVPEVTTPHPTEGPKTPPAVTPTPKYIPPVVATSSQEGFPVPSKPPTTPEPVVEEIFQKTKIGKKLEAMPGNILQKENLSLAADPLLIANTRLMDSEETVQLSSSEPKRLGAYIVIGLILLSFSSLVGYITFRKRMNRKRQEFESHQESNDTEKALLSLSDYKDNAELEENHLKNNEITPIVVKSNSQINKFEKNTNFSSPKNLNTIANEKNIEKDNVLKSTAENLTQVIIEDSPKDLEEDKNVPNLEKLIVKTRIDQDSIPKKPIIVNRSSGGYLPIPQDNS